MKTSNYLRNVALFLSLLIISLPLIHAEELNLIYDANGNLVTGDSFYREYNELNQLVRVREGNISTGTLLQEYIWHPTKEKIFKKKIYESGTLNQEILYINENFIVIKNASGVFNETYVYQNGQLVAQNINGKKQSLHPDHLGSTTLILDENGHFVESSFYSPFGEDLRENEASRYSYTGKEKNGILNEIDLGSRMYNPQWGRLTQSDKIFTDVSGKYRDKQVIATYDPQLLNHYAYARNNPFKYIDKDGEFIAEYFTGGFIATAAGILTLSLVATATAPVVVLGLAAVGIFAVASGITTATIGAVANEKDKEALEYPLEVIETPGGIISETCSAFDKDNDETEEEQIKRLKKSNLAYDIGTFAIGGLKLSGNWRELVSQGINIQQIISKINSLNEDDKERTSNSGRSSYYSRKYNYGYTRDSSGKVTGTWSSRGPRRSSSRSSRDD